MGVRGRFLRLGAFDEESLLESERVASSEYAGVDSLCVAQVSPSNALTTPSEVPSHIRTRPSTPMASIQLEERPEFSLV